MFIALLLKQGLKEITFTKEDFKKLDKEENRRVQIDCSQANGNVTVRILSTEQMEQLKDLYTAAQDPTQPTH